MNGYGRYILVETDFDKEICDEFYQLRFKNIYTG